MTFFVRLAGLLGFLLTAWSEIAFAQLTVTYPYPRTVIQRNQQNEAALSIAGYFSQPFDRIEVRFLSLGEQSGGSADWHTIGHDMRQGIFQDAVTLKGGWYRMEVRGIRNDKVTAETAVDRVGVGEVFLIAGQSNAMGIPNLGAVGASDWVNSFNALNKYLNNENVTVSSGNPFPIPVFSQLKAENNIYPIGETAWCWGQLGDRLVNRFRVPVTFINASFSSTAVRNWSETADGQPTTNIFVSKVWPNLQPYTNLANSLRYFHSQFGVRAVLWHQGETDAVTLHTSRSSYRLAMQHLIDRSRQDFGQNMTWLMARSSVGYVNPAPDSEVIGAQNDLITQAGNNVLPGPNTDAIQVPRQPHGHFENIPGGEQGLTEFADSWNQSMDNAFFQNSTPIQPIWSLVTGLMPKQVSRGSELIVTANRFGTVPAYSIHSVQLLNERGYFVAELARGDNLTFRCRLPDTLATGTYSVRLVSNYPVMNGVPSQRFLVTDRNQPVQTIVDSRAIQLGQQIEISWLTSAESTGGDFIVQQVEPNGQVIDLTTVPSQANGSSSRLYTYSTAQSEAGPHKYRILHRHPGGSQTLSPAIEVVTPGVSVPALPASQPLVFPNPTNGLEVAIRSDQEAVLSVRISDVTGRVHLERTFNQPKTGWFSLLPPGLLSNGFYLVEVTTPTGRFLTRLWVNN